MSRPQLCVCLCVWLRRWRERAGRESSALFLRPRDIVVVGCEPRVLVVRSEC